MNSTMPVVGIPADYNTVGGHPSYTVGEKYLDAVATGAGAIPTILPAVLPETIIDERERARAQLASVDGLFLTGSPSNMEPWRYGSSSQGVGPFDVRRDAQTLALLKEAMTLDMPVFAVCRGFQELNVACGGTLHTAVQEVPGLDDHREPDEASMEERYDLSHPIETLQDGWLDGLLGTTEFMVNSLHGQGVDQVGESLIVEGWAPDGLVEAIRHPQHRFVFGTQWHPEWAFRQNPVSRTLFRAFGEAARVFKQQKKG